MLTVFEKLLFSIMYVFIATFVGLPIVAIIALLSSGSILVTTGAVFIYTLLAMYGWRWLFKNDLVIGD